MTAVAFLVGSRARWGVAATLALVLPLLAATGAAAGPPDRGSPPAGEPSPIESQRSPVEGVGAPLQYVTVKPDRWLGVPLRPSRGIGSLQKTIDLIQGPARVMLLPGHYDLLPIAYTEHLCGNCENHDTPVSATRGLLVSGERIEIIGASAESVFVHTNSGYGILFEGCKDCALRGVTVTDGVRDPDPNATDAAVVVRAGKVTVEDCVIRGNIGDSAAVAATVVGIIGIAGREDSDIRVRDCRILRNSWDGVALYRGAKAVIRGSTIDGVDKATGATIGGGRGVGIGITWDADATVEGNLVTRYWKGIGIFVDGQARVIQNVVEDIVTWGIANWDAGRGRPYAEVRENAVYMTGACGASITRESAEPPPRKTGERAPRKPGAFVGNAFVMTGQNEKYDSPEDYCRQEALALEAVPEGFEIKKNLFFANREAAGAPGRQDMDEPSFRKAVGSLVERLARRPALRDSRFVAEFSK